MSAERAPWWHVGGIICFSFLYLVSSLIHLSTLIFEREWVFSLFQYMPEKVVSIRYSVSIGLRFIGLMVAGGLLFRKEWARKLACILSCFTIITLYWKHPYQGFVIHAQHLGERLGTTIHFDMFAFPAMILHIILDAVFCLCVLWFFSRPFIKKHFTG